MEKKITINEKINYIRKSCNWFKQIEEKNYVAEVKDYDVTKIVIVFKGKECRIETRK